MLKTLSRGPRAARPVGPYLMAAPALVALASIATAEGVLAVGDDRGGMIGARAQVIEGLREAHVRVEIRGSICLSSCAMYLGAGDVCVSPRTTFGFHGPTRYGQPLDPDDFEHWTAVMARLCAPWLRDWYLQGPRYRLGTDHVRLSAEELIRLGYACCEWPHGRPPFPGMVRIAAGTRQTGHDLTR